MTDISPKLYQKILQDFNELVSADKTLTALAENMTDYRKAALYAQRLGEHLSTVLQKNLTSGVLPDGKLYYNIANATVRPMLENNRDLVNLVARQVQEALNESAEIGVKAITPAPKNERIDGIIYKLSNADNIDDVAWVMGEPIVNITQSFVDDNIKANAEFHAELGLNPQIKRITSGGCCEWCANLAGTYDYSSDMARDVFRRHDRCRCMVLYDPKDGRGYQNTHKQSEWYGSLDEAELERRKKYGQPFSNNEAQRVIRERIANGEYSLKLSHQHYLKHIEGTTQFNSYLATRASQGKSAQSVLYLSPDETQDYIRKLAGTGTVKTGANTVYGQEYATCDKVIGKYYEKGAWHDTKRAMLIYGKRSSHLVPVKEID